MKKLLVLLAVLGLLILATGQVQAQNLLLNPGFEATGVPILGTSSQTTPSWTHTNNMPDGVNPSSQFRYEPWSSNPNGVPGYGWWLQAFEGNQATPPGTDPLAQASIYQDIPGTPGMKYILTAYHKQEANYLAGATLLGLEFLNGGGGSLGTTSIDLTGAQIKDGSWVQHMVMDVAPLGTATVRAFAQMVDGEDAKANPQSAFFDDFSLECIPEPASVALGLIALVGLIGFGRRR